MKFSFLLHIITLMIRLNMKRHPYLREMIRTKDHKVVLKTRDGKAGKRFNIRDGGLEADNELDEYDLALIWENADTAFKTLTDNDPTALYRAIANWDLEMDGDESLSVWFPIYLGYATGKLKKDG